MPSTATGRSARTPKFARTGVGSVNQHAPSAVDGAGLEPPEEGAERRAEARLVGPLQRVDGVTGAADEELV